MSPTGLVLIVVSALGTVAANLMIRTGLIRAGGFAFSPERIIALLKQPLFVFGFGLYALAAMIWMKVISTEDLSTSYPLLVSLTFIMVTAGAVLFFQERVSAQKMVGIAVILAGVIIVARS